MREGQPTVVHLKDYQPPAYRIRTANLDFKLDEDFTEVSAEYVVERQTNHNGSPALVLQGENMQLCSLALNGEELRPEQYYIDDAELVIHAVPERFSLQISVRIQPQLNTQLEGLYKSSGNFCTQCEAEGFRKIIYFVDRPDNLTTFTVRIIANKESYPVLLSNGNCVEANDLEEGLHYAIWQDPFPKPSYLFALVAGKLACQEGNFTTRSGREVMLRIYVEEHNIERCAHALASLKKAMLWDEETFGLEYDLDIYMIVAVDDFNMGAMENKGLNVFNSKCVLASPETATDNDYQTIEAVIAHEYFHNWTGNRVTCRDWFQLSLKEGLTVYRDQEFTADVTSRSVKRIRDVRLLRAHQFVEDAGPMAHPVRPDSFIEINNFYTVTVYEKGAEIVRMYETLFGKDGFRKGMDLYFQRHDGQAVTTDDFAAAMGDANSANLENFLKWYSQAGTPKVDVEEEWNGDSGQYRLTFQQSYPKLAGLPERDSVLIPIRIGLLGNNGEALAIDAGQDAMQISNQEALLLFSSQRQQFTFSGLKEKPVPSLLRGFSAPVKLAFDYSDQELALLIANDSDSFNRWEAGQRLAIRCLLDAIGRIQRNEEDKIYSDLIESTRALMSVPIEDPALVAEMLRLPDEAFLAEMISPIDVDSINTAREKLKAQLAEQLSDLLHQVYQQNRLDGDYRYHANDMGKRSLAAACLSLLTASGDVAAIELAQRHYQDANNMTDKVTALSALNDIECAQREAIFTDFERSWINEPLVLDKWFGLQASSSLPVASQRVAGLLKHEKFTLKNPNRVRAVLGAFVQNNPTGFHASDGSGYALLADQVMVLDEVNPQVTARLVKSLMQWRKYDQARQQLQCQQLQRIQQLPKLSSDVYELVTRALAD